MKAFKFTFIFFIFFTSYSYAAKIDDYIKIGQNNKVSINTDSINKTLSDATKTAQDEIVKKLEKEIQKLQDNINKNIANLTTKVDNEIKKATDKINNDIIGKAEKLVDDATKEYNSLIATKNNVISIAENLINNLPTYILIAKIMIGILFLGLFLLVFFFWRSYRNTKKLASAILGLGSLDSINTIDSRLNSIENKLDKIISNLK